MKRIAAFLFLLLLIAGTYYVFSRNKYYTAEGEIFGTSYHVKYSATQPLDKEILDELNKVDMALSMFKKESTLSRFNRNEAFEDNKYFDEVVKLALQISKETSGDFDITVAPLVNAWGFGFQNKDKITDRQIDSILQFVGYQKLLYKDQHLQKKDTRTTIDAGAIAKGYAVDCVARVLANHSSQNYMVEIGGEVVVHGKNEKGNNWSVGINKAKDDRTASPELEAVLSLPNKAVATSGNYRNFYYENGKKYAHTIDPHTGHPALHSILSATIVAPTCAQADAYATACMVMDVEKAQQFIAQQKQLEAFFIYTDAHGAYKTWASSGMQKLIK